MHILFLSDNFPPEVNAPASRTFEHCREWVRAGHQVTVITCAPNFPKGRVFGGYRNRLWQREAMEGIRVVRVWSYITANEGFTKRILDYMSYMVTATVAAPFVRRVDVVVGTSPQFFTVCAAWVVSALKRVPFVFELRDLWPESIKAVGAMKQGKAIDALERLEMFLYRKAAQIVSVTRSFKEILVRRGIDQGKIGVVTNGIDLTRFHQMHKDPELVDRFDLAGKFVAGYIGTHGMAHALETVLEAAQRIARTDGGDRFRFILLGDGARKAALKEKAAAMNLDNVIFIDSVPKQEVVRYWSLLDASIIHLKRTELFTTVIPSKLFDSMGMGIPVLHGVAGESARIVESEGAGLVFEPENAEVLCLQLERLASEEGLYDRLVTQGIEAAKKYDRKTLAATMLGILEQVVPESARGRVVREGR